MTVLEPANAVLAALQILSARNPRVYAQVRGEIEKPHGQHADDLGLDNACRSRFCREAYGSRRADPIVSRMNAAGRSSAESAAANSAWRGRGRARLR